LKKPLLYLLNPARKEKLPFDIDDQIYVEHTDDESLMNGLSNKMPLLLDKLLLLTGFDTEQKALIAEKLNSISSEAKELLKRIVLEGKFSFRSDEHNELDKWVTEAKQWEVHHLRELEANRFVVTETESGGTRTLKFKRFNEPYRRFLEELLFSTAQPSA